MTEIKKSKSSVLQWVFASLALGVILISFYLVVEPFIVPLIWAGILVLSTWPIFLKVRRFFPHRPGLAALIMSLCVFLIFILAVTPILISLSGEMQDAMKSLREHVQDGTFRKHIESIPKIGPRLQAEYDHYLGDRETALQTFGEYQERILTFATSAAKGVATGVVTFFAVMILSFFFYRDGYTLAAQVRRIAAQFGGKRSEELLHAVRDTVKGAVYGILLTALAQGMLAGIGYFVAGVPNPVLLGFVTLVFSLVPFGTPLVYLPAAGYLIANGDTLWGLILAGWGLGAVSTSDNILRPYFVSQSTSMPLLLSVIGVIGGLMAFGLLGLFIGPVVVAVVLALWREWLHEM